MLAVGSQPSSTSCSACRDAQQGDAKALSQLSGAKPPASMKVPHSPADLFGTFITTPSLTCCVQRACASCCWVLEARATTMRLVLLGAVAAMRMHLTDTARGAAIGKMLRPLAAAAALLETRCARPIGVGGRHYLLQ